MSPVKSRKDGSAEAAAGAIEHDEEARNILRAGCQIVLANRDARGELKQMALELLAMLGDDELQA